MLLMKASHKLYSYITCGFVQKMDIKTSGCSQPKIGKLDYIPYLTIVWRSHTPHEKRRGLVTSAYQTRILMIGLQQPHSLGLLAQDICTRN